MEGLGSKSVPSCLAGAFVDCIAGLDGDERSARSCSCCLTMRVPTMRAMPCIGESLSTGMGRGV